MNIKNIEKEFKYKEYLDPNFNWDDINFYTYENIFDEEFIDFFKDKINWNWLLDFNHKKVSENFLIKMERYINFNNINLYKIPLSDLFLKKHSLEINWDYFFMQQNFSFETFVKFKKYCDFDYVKCNVSISENLKQRILNIFNLQKIIKDEENVFIKIKFYFKLKKFLEVKK